MQGFLESIQGLVFEIKKCIMKEHNFLILETTPNS